jgi:hypothetical protein
MFIWGSGLIPLNFRANPGAKSHLVENAKLGKIYDVIDDYALLTDALSWMAAHPFPSSVSLE